MLETIQSRIKEYRELIDGTEMDKIFKCKIAELQWVIDQFGIETVIEKDADFLTKKFGVVAMREIGVECIGTHIGIETVAQYVRYRAEIKKPLKTTRPLKAFIRKLSNAVTLGYDIKQILDIVYDNEWQTFELEWIEKKLPKITTQSALSEFGFNQK